MGKVYCFFSAHYLPHLGGVERYTYNISQELMRRGNKVIIVTTEMDDLPAHEKKGNLEIYRLSAYKLLGGRFPIVKRNKKNRKIFKTLKNIKIDRAVVQTRFYTLSLEAAFFLSKYKIPFLVIEHGTGHFSVDNPIFDRVGALYEHMVSFLIKKKCKQFYGVSQSCNRWLEHFGIKAEGVLYNAVNLSDYNRKQDVSKEEFRIPVDKDIITYTGRLVKEKGIQKLISAYQEIKKEGYDASLCIAGDGELFQEYVDKQIEGVYLLGKLSHEKVLQLLQITDIFCLPTDYPEGFPTSVLEAVASNVYVVTTQEGGSKELISDDIYGKILEENTVRNIADALKYALKDEKMRKEAAGWAYEKLTQYFTWEKTVNDLEKAFGTT